MEQKVYELALTWLYEKLDRITKEELMAYIERLAILFNKKCSDVETDLLRRVL